MNPPRMRALVSTGLGASVSVDPDGVREVLLIAIESTAPDGTDTQCWGFTVETAYRLFDALAECLRVAVGDEPARGEVSR